IPRFRYYFFDVDGTLLDSAEDITSAVRAVLGSRGRNYVSDEFLRGQIGRHLIGTFQDVFPEYSPPELDELIREYRASYLGRRHQSTKVFQGVEETLAALGGAKSTATTKGTPTTRDVLDKFGLLDHFDHVQGTDGFPAKPEPDVVLRCLEVFRARPDQCLMVGDSMADIEAGRRAGVKTCAVRYGYGSAAIPEREPDYWITNLRQLLG
ncbi:MAG: HAD-IA family hydrolase, partial [bacterium]|nr:HAD-IA family hydrolase [bacterium]